ncbi:MAG: hypothetical protein PWQ91_408 [Eubacteriales bacterium]|nr:hypothetical protein [Eubacteriales bacterium]MDN5363347.1 hypothetical protein [Eubacteriales bacterium]
MFEKEDRELPAILKVADIKKLLRCSTGKAYEIVAIAERTGVFLVVRVGKSYRVPRNPFLAWLAMPKKSESEKVKEGKEWEWLAN